jgi:hypothetical protein
VVIQARRERVHEMLCRSFASRFDNRMLQKKKQLRWIASGFDTRFPLIYSKFIRDDFFGHPQRGRPTAGDRTPGKVNGSNATIESNFSNPSRR